jgi:hypothetical protein
MDRLSPCEAFTAQKKKKKFTNSLLSKSAAEVSWVGIAREQYVAGRVRERQAFTSGGK